jgi:hypothetical protein
MPDVNKSDVPLDYIIKPSNNEILFKAALEKVKQAERIIQAKLVYLASPYTHESLAVRELRFEFVCSVAAKLMREGVHLFCPIAHTHPLVKYGLPFEFDFWQKYDERILSMCSELWVLTMEGWRTSKGITTELLIATQLNLPIKYVNMKGEVCNGLA